jgi:hypothetical protein
MAGKRLTEFLTTLVYWHSDMLCFVLKPWNRKMSQIIRPEEEEHDNYLVMPGKHQTDVVCYLRWR